MTSSIPTVAALQPTTVELQAGETIHYCTCGRSATQPFCDGSHQGTEFQPQAFTPETTGKAQLCQCKQTANPPFCDGSHARVPSDQIGQEFHLASSEPGDPMPEAKPTPEEPTVALIHELAEHGLENVGPDGPVAAMGVPRSELPRWDDIQIMVAQLASLPLMENEPVGTDLVIGPESRRPLRLEMPLFVTDMSFGALSEEAKLAMAMGADLAGTGICSGEGGMLPEEQAANRRYFYELASGKFGFHQDVLERVQAFHFKAGQAAKTGTGGYLPGNKNTERIAQIRGIPSWSACRIASHLRRPAHRGRFPWFC